MAILTMMRHRFYKNDGTVNAGGKVYTYVAGTTTPTETYTSSSAAVANANPIILDSKGEADIWVSGQIKVNVLESDDTQVTGWPVDNVGSGVSNNDANARWAGTAIGSANALAISPSPAISAYVIGQSFIFKSGAAPNSGATTIAISGLSTIAVQSNGAACSGGEILADKWYQIVLSSLTVCQISKIGEPTLAELGAAALAGSASQVFSAASLELGHASDTTLSRVSAGVVSVDGVTVLTTATGVESTGDESIAGIKTFSDTTDASSSTVGGTVVSGGLAVAKAVHSGSLITGTGFRTNSGATSAVTNTFTTLFTATAGTYLVYMRLADAGASYIAEGIAVFDTAAGTMLQTANGASAALQVSGMNVQGRQTSGGTTNINWSFLKIQ